MQNCNSKFKIALGVLITMYIVYFSFFTILRYKNIYASYFDLGIMHQTVFNTFRAITELDPSRILELTNPFGVDQIKRMAIHNDLLLAPIAILYFIYPGPETLLVLQTIVLGIGAYFVFKIACFVITKKLKRYSFFAPLIFAFAYLMYSPMQRANIFEFHSVTLATTFILAMFYYWLVKRYRLSVVFFILSLLTKEQVALTTLFFGIYALIKTKNKRHWFAWFIMSISIFWFFLSFYYIIPLFRGARHFALSYYGDFGESPMKFIFHIDTLRYFLFLLGPLAFLSLFSPLQLLIALPEFTINLFSSNWNMRNIIYHYTSVITPFVFISAIYGFNNVFDFIKRKFILSILIGTVFIFAFTKGPLPFSREQDIYFLLYPQDQMKRDILIWKDAFKDESLKISSTGHIAPFFTSRRYFYNFSSYYYYADYLVLDVKEIYNGWQSKLMVPAYEKLIRDTKYQRIYKNGGFEVYKKILISNF